MCGNAGVYGCGHRSEHQPEQEATDDVAQPMFVEIQTRAGHGNSQRPTARAPTRSAFPDERDKKRCTEHVAARERIRRGELEGREEL